MTPTWRENGCPKSSLTLPYLVLMIRQMLPIVLQNDSGLFNSPCHQIAPVNLQGHKQTSFFCNNRTTTTENALYGMHNVHALSTFYRRLLQWLYKEKINKLFSRPFATVLRLIKHDQRNWRTRSLHIAILHVCYTSVVTITCKKNEKPRSLINKF